MAVRYYDDVLAAKLKRWNPSSDLRVLKPNEVKRFFQLAAEDSGDKPIKLPFVTLSRNNDIELELNYKSPKSYAGIKLSPVATTSELLRIRDNPPAETLIMNAIPIKLQYQLDIYTKTMEEGDEYLRQYLFKLINNPVIKILVPYNGVNIEQIANIRVLTSVSDTSDISERLFSGQFTRWTIQLEIQDAFLYDVPYRKNWTLYIDENQTATEEDFKSSLDVVTSTEKFNKETDFKELIDLEIKKEENN